MPKLTTPPRAARRSVDPAAPLDPSALEAIKGRRLLVAGDILLDRYIWGDVERISPEAPVPVVLSRGVTDVAGGALNVARNIVAAGGEAVMLGVAGEDEEGERVAALVRELGMDPDWIVRSQGRPTTLKTRIMSGGQQLLRLDREESGALDAATHRLLAAFATKAARSCDGVIVSDYGKGVVTPGLIRAAAGAVRRGVPVCADPKSRDLRLYAGADYLTPNLKEASEAAGRPLSGDAAVEAEGRRLLKAYGGRGIVVTRGAEGLSLIPRTGVPFHLPAHAREVFDVTGAGDTFIAHFTLGLSAGFSPAQSARLGNAAAGVAVSKLGAVTVSPAELAAALGAGGEGLSKTRTAEDLRLTLDHLRAAGKRIVLTNGCFDLFHAGHVRLLREAKALGDVLVAALNTDASVRRVKGPPRPILPAGERAAILSALAAVDYVVFYDEDTPEAILAKLRPDVLVKGRRKGETVVGAEMIRSRGGVVAELPFFEVTGTGEIVRKLRGGA